MVSRPMLKTLGRVRNETNRMSDMRQTNQPTPAKDLFAGVLTVIVLSNGLLSALVGNWIPTILTLALIAFTSWYGNRQ